MFGGDGADIVSPGDGDANVGVVRDGDIVVPGGGIIQYIRETNLPSASPQAASPDDLKAWFDNEYARNLDFAIAAINSASNLASAHQDTVSQVTAAHEQRSANTQVARSIADGRTAELNSLRTRARQLTNSAGSMTQDQVAGALTRLKNDIDRLKNEANQNIGFGLGGVVGSFVEQVGGSVDSVVSGATSILQEVFEQGKEFTAASAQQLASALRSGGATAQNFVREVNTAVNNSINDVNDVLQQAFTTIAQAFNDAIQSIENFSVDLNQSLSQIVQQLSRQLSNFVDSLATDFPIQFGDVSRLITQYIGDPRGFERFWDINIESPFNAFWMEQVEPQFIRLEDLNPFKWLEPEYINTRTSETRPLKDITILATTATSYIGEVLYLPTDATSQAHALSISLEGVGTSGTTNLVSLHEGYNRFEISRMSDKGVKLTFQLLDATGKTEQIQSSDITAHSDANGLVLYHTQFTHEYFSHIDIDIDDWEGRELGTLFRAFDYLVHLTGSTRILRNAEDVRVHFEKAKELSDGAAGLNTGGRKIEILDWDETSEFEVLSYIGTIIHEIGHNWDDTVELANAGLDPSIIERFRAKSGWNQIRDKESDELQWRYDGDLTKFTPEKREIKLLSGNTITAIGAKRRNSDEPYGTTSPLEDWSEMWEEYYRAYREHGKQYFTGSNVDYGEKFNPLTEFYEAIGSL